jgi:anti-sigma factor RsiW
MTERKYGDADLHTYLDGEMPAEERTEFEAWLNENPAERRRLDAFRDDVRRLRAELDPVLSEPMPERIVVALGDAGAVGSKSVWWQAAAAVLVFAAGGAVGWFAAQSSQSPVTIGSGTAEQALSAHRVYVAEALHAVEVGADQKPHLVGWLSKRLGHPLTVPVLREAGFDLVGGRLLPTDAAAAAQLMYEDAAGERVTLYVTNNPGGGQTAFELARRGETHAFYWLDGLLGFALSGDIGEERLLGLAHIVYGQLVGGQSG